MTFEQFAASKVFCDDLTTHFGNQCFDDSSNKGFVYAEHYWIIQNEDGDYWTVIGSDDRASGDLAKLEKWLWDNFANGDINGE